MHGQLEARVTELTKELMLALEKLVANEKGRLATEAVHNATVATLVARVASLKEETKAAADAAEEALKAAVEAVTRDAAKAAEAAVAEEEEAEEAEEAAEPCPAVKEAAEPNKAVVLRVLRPPPHAGGVGTKALVRSDGDGAKAVSIAERTLTPALCFRADASAWRKDYKEWPTPVDFLEGTHNLRSFTITFWMKTDVGCPQARLNEHWFDGCGLITASPPGPPSWTWSGKARQQRCVAHECACMP